MKFLTMTRPISDKIYVDEERAKLKLLPFFMIFVLRRQTGIKGFEIIVFQTFVRFQIQMY